MFADVCIYYVQLARAGGGMTDEAIEGKKYK